MSPKPDRIAVRLGDVTTLRITADQQILLKKDLTVEQLRDTVKELADGIMTLHATTLIALTNAFGDTPIADNGACTCGACDLRRLRDQLSAPQLH